MNACIQADLCHCVCACVCVGARARACVWRDRYGGRGVEAVDHRDRIKSVIFSFLKYDGYFMSLCTLQHKYPKIVMFIFHLLYHSRVCSLEQNKPVENIIWDRFRNNYIFQFIRRKRYVTSHYRGSNLITAIIEAPPSTAFLCCCLFINEFLCLQNLVVWEHWYEMGVFAYHGLLLYDNRR